MNNILPTHPARRFCSDLKNALESLGFTQETPGRTFGILTCTDGTVLASSSGDSSFDIPGFVFVPPVYDTIKRNKLLEDANDNPTSDKSRECWKSIAPLYRFHCWDGQIRTLDEIAPNAPSGTGDCCEPRLLSYCYETGRQPLSMATFFMGSGAFEHGSFTSPCDSRCALILKHIVGLDIIYRDPDIVVVNKPSGLLSVPGRGEDKADCVVSRVKHLFPDCIDYPSIHRLDMDTSGILVLGLTQKAHDRLSEDFENRRVSKQYEALVEGVLKQEEGIIDLPIAPDPNDRPYVKVSNEYGKNAVTEWKRIRVEERDGKLFTRLLLTPHTGRTHQLRVHCASGLGHPIAGDRLYGDSSSAPRLMLQARILEFTHPITHKSMRFEVSPDF